MKQFPACPNYTLARQAIKRVTCYLAKIGIMYYVIITRSRQHTSLNVLVLYDYCMIALKWETGPVYDDPREIQELAMWMLYL